VRVFSGSSRLKRAIRAGIPILGAALILGGGALAWSAFSSSRQLHDPLVVGIGDSTRTGAVSQFDEETRAGDHNIFFISGNVNGLYPGGSATLALRVHNPLHRSIRVETITIISGPANSGCSASNLVAGSGQAALNSLYTITLSPPLVVPSGQSVNGPRVAITLLGSAPNACQNATFVLLYSGRATRADGDNDFDNDENDDTQPDQP
jgi:hypothetical protein